MMAEKEMRNQFRSAITAAAVCCRMPVSDETSSITQYLKSLLDTALDGAGLYAEVMPLPYQPCSKLPVVIALDGKIRGCFGITKGCLHRRWQMNCIGCSAIFRWSLGKFLRNLHG